MSNSEPGARKVLLVETQDETGEIFIINAHFHMIAHAVGMHARFELAPGVYTVILRTGDQSIERITALYPEDVQPKTVEFSAGLAFDSAAPILGTNRTHEYHEIAAFQYSRETLASPGKGSAIFVLARDWSSLDGPRKAKTRPVDNPAAGLTLRNRDGQVLFDYATQAANNNDLHEYQDPWCAAKVEVDPGAYRLSLELPNQERIELPLTAVPNWQLQVCLLQTDYLSPPTKVRRANLATAAIFLYHDGYPQQPGYFDKFLRTADLARQGLTKTRPVVNQDVFNMIIDKWDDPFLGITGLHLLLRDPSPPPDLVHNVINNLRGLLGKHPDVEALAWKVGMEDPSYVFDLPPVVRAGWEMMLDASIQHPETVPASSLAAQVSSHLWGSGAWLTWQTPRPESSGAALSSQQSQMLSDLVEQTSPQPKSVDSEVFFGLPAEPAEPDAQTVSEMVKILRIPASQVVELLKKR